MGDLAMSSPPGSKPYVKTSDQRNHDRIALSHGARNCIHGKKIKLEAKQLAAMTGPICHACEWEAPRWKDTR